MSRARVLLLVPVLAAGILVAGAGPAYAATQSPNANCLGLTASSLNQNAHGLGGQVLKEAAHFGDVASACQNL